MKLFDRLFPSKFTSEKIMLELETVIAMGMRGIRKDTPLFDVAFPGHDALDQAKNILQNEFKRLDKKNNIKEKEFLLKRIYLECKREQKLAHQIGIEVNEFMVLPFIFLIDPTALTEFENACNEESFQMVYDRYTKVYRQNFMRRYVLYVLIDVGLRGAYEKFFGNEIDQMLVDQFQLLNNDHCAKLAGEVLLKYHAAGFTADEFGKEDLIVASREYDFLIIERRSKALNLFLDAVEQDNENALQVAMDDYLESMGIFNSQANEFLGRT